MKIMRILLADCSFTPTTGIAVSVSIASCRRHRMLHFIYNTWLSLSPTSISHSVIGTDHTAWNRFSTVVMWFGARVCSCVAFCRTWRVILILILFTVLFCVGCTCDDSAGVCYRPLLYSVSVVFCVLIKLLRLCCYFYPTLGYLCRCTPVAVAAARWSVDLAACVLSKRNTGWHFTVWFENKTDPRCCSRQMSIRRCAYAAPCSR